MNVLQYTGLHKQNPNYHSPIQSQFELLLQSETLDYFKYRLYQFFEKINIETTPIDNNIITIKIVEPLRIPKSLIENKYQIFITVRINKFPLSIKFEAVICKNSLPLLVKSKHLLLLLSKHLATTINNRMQAIRVNPQNRQFQITSQTLLTNRQKQKLIKNKVKMFQFIKSYTLRLIFYLNQNCIDLLQSINEFYRMVNKNLSINQRDYREIVNNQLIKFNGEITKIITVSHTKVPIPKTARPQKIVDTGQDKQITEETKKPTFNQWKRDLENEIKQQNKNSNTNTNIEVDILIKTYNNAEENLKITDIIKFIENKIKQLETQKYLSFPISKAGKGEKNNIISKINILNLVDTGWDILMVGGFGVIEKAKVQFVYNEIVGDSDDDQEKIKKNKKQKQKQKEESKIQIIKLLVRKNQRYNVQKSKIKKQKQLLKTIADYQCPYIAKFYYSNQPQYKNSLLIDYYTYKSLEIYKSINKKTFSLFNKLYMICQIIQAMRFYSDLSLVHLDIKPGNVLVGRSLIVRISDFGQARSIDNRKTQNKQDFPPAYTFPYTSPELFDSTSNNSNNFKYHKSLDVYSLGIMIHEIVFEKYPIQVSQQHQLSLIQSYQINKADKQEMKNVLVTEQDLIQYGDKQIMANLRKLCLKCMHPNPKKRPNLDWLIIILRDILKYLENKY